MAEPNPPFYRHPSLQRLLLAALALMVSWLSIGSYLGWTKRLDELTEIAVTLGVSDRRPGLLTGMRRDAGPTRAALRLARAILADELDQRWILDLPPEDHAEQRRRGLEHLDVAYALGVESLAERPGSWEALLVIGGAEYLRSSRRRDQRQPLDRAPWLAPLEEAHRLAPRQPEPLRFLAAADLGNWSVLSEDDKQRSIARLELAFLDATTFDLLSSAWLRVAPSLTQALAIVPDKTWAWSGLMRLFARRGDWERYCDARRRSAEVVRSFSYGRLDEAESRMRWGDRNEGIQQLLWVGSHARPDASNVELIERVLAMFPPGVGGEASDRWLRRWLDWSLERCMQATGCPLASSSLRRLISLNRDLSPETRAWALAAAGSLREAEAIERSYRKDHAGPLGVEWTPYVTRKARLLATERGATERGAAEALGLLKQVPLLGRDSVPYWQAYKVVARAAREDLEEARADEWLATQARDRWARGDWHAGRRTARLDIWPAGTAAGLALDVDLASDGRGVLELVWDGTVVETVPAIDGSTLELAIPVTADAHILEIRSEEGAPSATATVRLLALER